ncbi:sigma-54-dependent Fis family transcriptional regulator [Marinomonas sp. IMCC 4694]|uniref:sigma-54-dependent Fis family transcriptional regulator n=1 Tax=Marinomonas sp. IMCC 4694 TaxID=2605432 RepID=UPI0011E647F3|nr:sigma-54-dependent Fis family transcriptional regulator [Marinomonas sp. IMCC 4694]TYL46926.1 sigma-54-dependent Fis family transcriptional regulator [Marinomonas sp. IMCC 4694]
MNKNNKTLHNINETIDDDVLAQYLRFTPDSGHIHLFDQRMLLMHCFSMTSLRQELIERLGLDKTRELFTRIGYQQGVEDGRCLRQYEGGNLKHTMALGPRLREIEGFIHNQAVNRMAFNMDTGEFHGDYYWQSSWEGEAHHKHFGIGGQPACWMMTGYANGFTTTMMGRPIIWREVECIAMGHPHCRVIGQPLEEFEDTELDLSFMKLESFVSAPGKTIPSSDTPFTGQPETTEPMPELIGVSAPFNAAIHLLKRVGSTDATVLLNGESGVGKERFAKTLHAIGKRADTPFISINCAAIPHDLVEAELFGVEKGAYTGATVSRHGRFERANGGTLFLDEIASLPLSAQGKLLRVLQEGEVERLGGSEVINIDVRIVAAANRDLREEVREGRFREDLFFRLNVFPINIPALRERREDIPLLMNVFVKRYSSRFNKKINGITQAAHAALWAYGWPGNVRELENIVERGVIMADNGDNLDVYHLFSGGEQIDDVLFRLGQDGHLHKTLPTKDFDDRTTEQMIESLIESKGSLEALENMVLKYALERSKGNISAAARMLKMRRGQFEYRLKNMQKLQHQLPKNSSGPKKH